MSVTKNAPLRYRLIDECLCRTRVRWTAEKLLETVSEKFEEFTGKTVSKSQLNQDIRAMKEGGTSGYDAPIEFDRATGRYCYTEEGFTIRNSPILLADTEVLRQALAVLQQFQGLGLSEQLDELVGRVEKQVSLQGRPVQASALQFEQVPDYAGAAQLRPLHQAIQQKHVLELAYQPFGVQEPQALTVHPYLLKEFNHRWFLLAYSEKEQRLQIYALDRIRQATATPAFYQAEHRPNLEDYFQHVIGPSVPPDGQVQEVLLRFAKSRAPYVLTKPLHVSQQVVQEGENCLDLSLRVIPNRELVSLLLGFGADLTVLSPPALREAVAEQHRRSVLSYVDCESGEPTAQIESIR